MHLILRPVHWRSSFVVGSVCARFWPGRRICGTLKTISLVSNKQDCGKRGFYLQCHCHSAYLCMTHSMVHNPTECLVLVSTDSSLNTQAMLMPWMFVVLTLGRKKSTKMTIWSEIISFSVFVSWRQAELNKRRQCKNVSFDYWLKQILGDVSLLSYLPQETITGSKYDNMGIV